MRDNVLNQHCHVFNTANNNLPVAPINSKNLKLDNAEGSVPLQIKYHIEGGQKIDSNEIKPAEWNADNKKLLTGTVVGIDIGIPEAIYLAEGCS